MKRFYIPLFVISVLCARPVYGSELSFSDFDTHRAGVTVRCVVKEDEPVITPTPTPTKTPTPTPTKTPTPKPTKTPTPKPTATPTPAPKKDNEDDLPWWFKYLRRISDEEKTTEGGSTTINYYYYTAPAQQKETIPAAAATPASAAKTAASQTADTKTSAAKTTSSVSGTKTAVTPTPTPKPSVTPNPVATPVVKKSDESKERNMDEIRRRMIEAQIRFIPNEYYHNGAKPIPKPSATPTPTPIPKEVPKEEVIPAKPIEEAPVEIVEPQEDKIPWYKNKTIWFIGGGALILLILILLLIHAIRSNWFYKKKNRKMKNERPKISGVLTDEESDYIDIIAPKGEKEYTILQTEINRAKTAHLTPDDLYDRLKSSNYKTILPLYTTMVITVYDDNEKKSSAELRPRDEEILRYLRENEGKRVKVEFSCEKADFEDSLSYELMMPDKKEKNADHKEETDNAGVHRDGTGLDPHKNGT